MLRPHRCRRGLEARETWLHVSRSGVQLGIDAAVVTRSWPLQGNRQLEFGRVGAGSGIEF